MKIRKSSGSKRAAIYLRMSSSPQKDSIAQQREACRLYAADHGYEIVEEYADEAISGIDSRLRRKGFQKLVEDAESGRFEFVICWEQNRASRSKPREFFTEMAPLADAGVKLVFTDKGVVDLDNFTDFLTTAVSAHSNNEYVVSMARSVVRGQHEKKALHGKWVGGTPPLGYDFVRTDPRVDPKAGDVILGDSDDVETVREIYRLYLEGLSDRMILKRLKDDRGVTHGQSVIQRVLTNPMYAGDYRWNITTRGKLFALRGGRITSEFETGTNAKSDQVFIPDNHPAIIDRETWTRVQHLRAERAKKTTPFRGGGVHLLTGICRCAKCGSGFSGSREKSKNGKSPDRLLLTCNGYRHGKCKRHIVNQRDVLASIVASLDSVLDAENVADIRAAYEDDSNASRDAEQLAGMKTELTRRQVEYAALRSKIKKLPDEVMEDFADDLRTDKAAIVDLTTKIENAEADLRDDDSATIRFDSQVAAVSDIIGALKEAIADLVDVEPGLIRNLIASLVESIELDVESEPVSEKFTRYHLRSGEITLKPGFNLICAS